MEKNPEVLNKLVPVEGDVTVVDLGLTDEKRNLLKDVSVIFHSAASVRFDENYKTAIILNTKGTHEVIKFALTLKNLVSFVHVSTTYCYPDHQFIDEKVGTECEKKNFSCHFLLPCHSYSFIRCPVIGRRQLR